MTKYMVLKAIALILIVNLASASYVPTRAQKYQAPSTYETEQPYKADAKYPATEYPATEYPASTTAPSYGAPAYPSVETYEDLPEYNSNTCQQYSIKGYNSKSNRYEALSANQKYELLWGEILKDQRTGRYPTNKQFSYIQVQDPAVTLTYVSDIIPCNRRKLIHVQGLVQRAILKSEPGNSYTGVFQGAKNIILRYSLADAVDFSIVREGASGEEAYQLYSPSIAMKILQDGKPSANLFGMYSFDGQNSWNWWKNDLSNILPNPRGQDTDVLHQRFSQATIYTQITGLIYAARAQRSSKKYLRQAQIKTPFKIIYRPNPEYQKMFSDSYSSKEDWIYQIRAVKKGEELYSVWAIENPKSGCEKKIGSIIADSYAYTSRFADEQLFFQHQDWKHDLEHIPAWIPFSPSRNPYLRPFKPIGKCRYAENIYPQKRYVQ